MFKPGPIQSHINVAWAAEAFGVSQNTIVNRVFGFYITSNRQSDVSQVMIDVDHLCVAFNVARESLDKVIQGADSFVTIDEACTQLGVGERLLKRRKYAYAVDAPNVKRFSQIDVARQHVAHRLLKQQKLF